MTKLFKIRLSANIAATTYFACLKTQEVVIFYDNTGEESTKEHKYCNSTGGTYVCAH